LLATAGCPKQGEVKMKNGEKVRTALNDVLITFAADGKNDAKLYALASAIEARLDALIDEPSKDLSERGFLKSIIKILEDKIFGPR
jgi:hypothetical protein